MNPNEAVLLWVDEYSRMAQAYEANVVPRFAPFAEKLVARSALPRNAMILDIGTGTGLTAILAAKETGGTGLVVGIDLAEEALHLAETKAARAGLRNLRFEMLDSRNIVYRSGTFDAVLTSFGLPTVGHEQVIGESYRLLKEGGSLHMVGWSTRDASSGWDAFDEILQRHQTSSPSTALVALREARDLVTKSGDYAAIQSPETVTAKLRGAGFIDVRSEAASREVTFENLDDIIAFRGSWGTTERELAELGDRESFRSDLRARFEDYAQPEGYLVRWSVTYYDAKK